VITLQDLYKFKVDRVTADRSVIGSLQPTGLRPAFTHKFEKRGITLPQDLFVNGQILAADVAQPTAR
jgi:pilus assembly protein CpaF